MYLKLIFKSSIFVRFGTYLNHIVSEHDIPVQRWYMMVLLNFVRWPIASGIVIRSHLQITLITSHSHLDLDYVLMRASHIGVCLCHMYVLFSSKVGQICTNGEIQEVLR